MTQIKPLKEVSRSFPPEKPYDPAPGILEKIKAAIQGIAENPPVRDRIFTTELASVTSEVLSHIPDERITANSHSAVPSAVSEKANRAATNITDNSLDAYFDRSLDVLSKVCMEDSFALYRNNTLDSDLFIPILNQIKKTTSAHSIAILLADSLLLVFRPFLDLDLDFRTRKNLYFSLKDKYLDTDASVQVLRFSNNLKQDLHFMKKFSTDCFNDLAGAVVLSFAHYGLPGFIFLFYQENSKVEDASEVPHFLSDLTDLIPALHRLQLEHTLVGETSIHQLSNPAWNILQSIKEFSDSGKEKFCIFHVRLENILDHPGGRVLLDQLTELISRKLRSGEKIMILSPRHLVLLLRDSQVSGMEQSVRAETERFSLEINTVYFNFPDYGRNLFNYIYFPD